MHATITLNTCLLMKQVWRMHKNPSFLLAKVFFSKKYKSILSDIPSTITPSSSWGMKGLRMAELCLSKSYSWKIGNGKKILAFSHRWVNNELPEVGYGPTFF